MHSLKRLNKHNKIRKLATEPDTSDLDFSRFEPSLETKISKMSDFGYKEVLLSTRSERNIKKSNESEKVLKVSNSVNTKNFSKNIALPKLKSQFA